MGQTTSIGEMSLPETLQFADWLVHESGQAAVEAPPELRDWLAQESMQTELSEIRTAVQEALAGEQK